MPGVKRLRVPCQLLEEPVRGPVLGSRFATPTFPSPPRSFLLFYHPTTTVLSPSHPTGVLVSRSLYWYAWNVLWRDELHFVNVEWSFIFVRTVDCFQNTTVDGSYENSLISLLLERRATFVSFISHSLDRQPIIDNPAHLAFSSFTFLKPFSFLGYFILSMYHKKKVVVYFSLYQLIN